jgi:hypothetical protein
VPHGWSQRVILILKVVRVACHRGVSHKLKLLALLLLLVLEIVCGDWRHQDQVSVGELDILLCLVPTFLALGNIAYVAGAGVLEERCLES